MSTLRDTARAHPDQVRRARVALTQALLRTGRRTSEVVRSLQSECGVCRTTAYRTLRQARVSQNAGA